MFDKLAGVLPAENIHRIHSEQPDAAQAAADYAAELQRFGGEGGPRFDVILLGMGPEGHTASLFPGTTGLRETAPVASAFIEKVGTYRITFTPPVLRKAAALMFLVAGKDKADMLRDGARRQDRRARPLPRAGDQRHGGRDALAARQGGGGEVEPGVIAGRVCRCCPRGNIPRGLRSGDEPVTPIIRVAAVVLERQEAKLIRQEAIVNRVGEPRHQVTPNVRFHNAPPFGRVLDDADGSINGIKKLGAERGNPPFVELGRRNQFRLGVRVISQAHPTARRAACMTSSCVRPTTAPEESSWSRRIASRIASPSSVSAKPASILCQSAWAKATRSESGRAIASVVSCWVDMAAW